MYGAWKWLVPKAVRLAKRRAARAEALDALPQALADVTAMRGQIDSIAGMAKRVQQMVLPNGGSSLPDKMDRIERAVAAQGKEITALANLQKAAQNTNTRMATFECRLDGRLTDANKTYARWTGLQVTELLNWGWINTIAHAQQARVRREYGEAIADARACTLEYSMIDHTGVEVPVELTLTPVPDNGAAVESFFGSILRMEQDD